MRSNALRKDEFEQAAPQKATATWETFRLHIATQAEAACNIPGNIRTPDFEEFLLSDFA